MKLGEFLKRYREEHKISMDVLAEKTGLSKSYISILERDFNPSTGKGVSPTLTVIRKIAEATGISFDDLINILDDDYEVTFENDNLPLTKKEQILNSIKLYDNPVSAGRGAWLDDGCEYSFEEIDKPPVDADFALRVRGDSMSPLYNDDDVVFVKANVLVEQGQVGVFLLNSEGYLKQWQGNKLVSLNSEYDPIFITDEDEFRVIGKVVRKR